MRFGNEEILMGGIIDSKYLKTLGFWIFEKFYRYYNKKMQEFGVRILRFVYKFIFIKSLK